MLSTEFDLRHPCENVLYGSTLVFPAPGKQGWVGRSLGWMTTLVDSLQAKTDMSLKDGKQHSGG